MLELLGSVRHFGAGTIVLIAARVGTGSVKVGSCPSKYVYVAVYEDGSAGVALGSPGFVRVESGSAVGPEPDVGVVPEAPGDPVPAVELGTDESVEQVFVKHR
jgi:hypothetical protein